MKRYDLFIMIGFFSSNEPMFEIHVMKNAEVFRSYCLRLLMDTVILHSFYLKYLGLRLFKDTMILMDTVILHSFL